MQKAHLVSMGRGGFALMHDVRLKSKAPPAWATSVSNPCGIVLRPRVRVRWVPAHLCVGPPFRLHVPWSTHPNSTHLGINAPLFMLIPGLSGNVAYFVSNPVGLAIQVGRKGPTPCRGRNHRPRLQGFEPRLGFEPSCHTMF